MRSQAIHSAVVEYEALTAKRQAAVALARDVKCWNVHRKKQLVRTCLEIVRSQKKIAHETKSAWEGLRDGLQESSPISNIVHSSVKACEITKPPANVSVEPPVSQQYGVESFNDSFQGSKEGTMSPIPSMAPFHHSVDYVRSPQTPDTESSYDKNFDMVSPSTTVEGSGSITYNNASVSQSPECKGNFHDTFEENIPVEDGNRKLEQEEVRSDIGNDLGGTNIDTELAGDKPCTRNIESEPEITEDNESENCPTHVGEPTPPSPYDNVDANSSRLNNQILADEGAVSYSNITSLEVSSDNGMTDSMQSLVDGLMNWGGQFDEEEDLAPLPQGMAASMLEERGILDLQ